MHTAKAAMTAGALTPATLARLSPAVAAAVRSAATDWSALTPGQRLELAFAVLLETTGTMTFPLPPSLTFNAAELVVGELTGYSGILTLPPATAAAPGVCPLITSLRCRSSGVDGTVMLGGLGITGTLNRRPGTTFLLVVALSPVVALAIPALAWAVPLVASAGIFLLLDSATASVTLSGISADFRVRFVPDGLSVLKAQVSVGVTAAASVSLSSSVPTGLHQIADLVTSAIASSGRILVDLVGSALGVQLTRIVARTFGRGFPAAFLPVGVPVLSSFVNGQDDSHLYLESQLAAPAGTSLNTIPVRADARESARQDAALIATATPSQRHYISLVSSQNSLNALLAADFVRRRFDAVFDQADRNALRSLAPSPYPTGTSLLMARLRATAPPRLTLRQATPSGTAQHGDLQLDMRLVLGPDKEQRFAWTFRLDAPVQIVVGSAAESTKPKIELLTAYTQPIDVLIDLAGAAVQVSAVQAIQVIRHQITEEITSPTGHPTTISYTLEEEVETTTGLSGPTAAAVQPLALSAVRLGLNWRDIRRAPRRDGVSATGGATGQPDPLTVQTYLLDGTDPDDVNLSTAAAFARADLGFRSGLLFQHISLAGLVVGALDPGSLGFQTCAIAGGVLDLIGRPNLDP